MPLRRRRRRRKGGRVVGRGDTYTRRTTGQLKRLSLEWKRHNNSTRIWVERGCETGRTGVAVPCNPHDQPILVRVLFYKLDCERSYPRDLFLVHTLTFILLLPRQLTALGPTRSPICTGNPYLVARSARQRSCQMGQCSHTMRCSH